MCGSLCNSSLNSQVCNSQRLLGPSLAVSKITCNALYSPHSNTVCSNSCGTVKSTHNPQFLHHPSIPHSKSLDHYNEPSKFLEHQNVSRHSFDQPFSLNSKNYDCTDGSNNFVGLHQPNCNMQNPGSICNPMRTTIPFPDHHYSQIGECEHETNMGICCHQNPHYECLNNFNARSILQKSKNGIDYGNCNFQSK